MSRPATKMDRTGFLRRRLMPGSRPQRIARWLVAMVLLPVAQRAFAQPPPATLEAFQEYSAAVEARTRADRSAGTYLRLNSSPESRRRLQSGEILTVPAGDLDLDPHVSIPGGQVQHWLGAAFIPHANLAHAVRGLQNYNNRKRYMQPVIIDSRILSHNGNNFRIYLRMRQKALLSAVFDVVQRITYTAPDPTHVVIESKSESVREVPSEQSPRGTPARNRGLIWVLDDYWRLTEQDGGVYIECEALVLSRQVPVLIRWFAGGLIAGASERMLAGTLKADVRIIQDAQDSSTGESSQAHKPCS